MIYHLARGDTRVIDILCVIVVKNAAAHHAISAKFDKPVDNTGKALVVQYEVKLQSTLP